MAKYDTSAQLRGAAVNVVGRALNCHHRRGLEDSFKPSVMCVSVWSLSCPESCRGRIVSTAQTRPSYWSELSVTDRRTAGALVRYCCLVARRESLVDPRWT